MDFFGRHSEGEMPSLPNHLFFQKRQQLRRKQKTSKYADDKFMNDEQYSIYFSCEKHSWANSYAEEYG